MIINNSYNVVTLAEPENLNQHEFNGDYPYQMTMKYVIEGFQRVIFVVEVEVENKIIFMYLENVEEYYSVRIKNQDVIDVCNELMTEYLNRHSILN